MPQYLRIFLLLCLTATLNLIGAESTLASLAATLNNAANYVPGHKQGVATINAMPYGIEAWRGFVENDRQVDFRCRFKTPVDLSGIGSFSFMMKGAGRKNAFKIALMDNTGKIRLYGPFWLNQRSWRRYSFDPAKAVWGHKGADFNLASIQMLSLVQDFGDPAVKFQDPVRLRFLPDCAPESAAFDTAFASMGIAENYQRTTSFPGDIRQSDDGLVIWEKSQPGGAPKFVCSFDAPTDFSRTPSMHFEMLGNGIENAVKITLHDAAGIPRMYGPFWTTNNGWGKFQFLTAHATWKVKNDADFNMKEVVSMTIDVADKKGAQPARIAPVTIRFTLPAEEKPYARQWQCRKLDANGFYLVDGKPFFPQLMYSVVGFDATSSRLILNDTAEFSPEKNHAILKEIREAGFNAILSYTVPFHGDAKTPEARIAAQLTFLDMCRKADLKVLLCCTSLGSLPIKGDSETQKQQKAVREAELAAMAKAVKDHPAMLGYYIADEPFPQSSPKEQLQDAYRAIKEVDDANPVVIIECSPPGFALYNKAADIIGPDTYPVDKNPLPDMVKFSSRIKECLQAIHRKAPNAPALWHAIQVYKVNERGNPFVYSDKGRYPTLNEYRAMVFLSVINGARGLLNFTYGELPTWRNIPTDSPEAWQNYTIVNQTLTNAMPAILSADEIDTVQSDTPKVEFTARRANGALYIIACLPSNGKTPQGKCSVTFTLPAEYRQAVITALDENADGNVAPGKNRPLKGGATFTDSFSDNITHIYKITK